MQHKDYVLNLLEALRSGIYRKLDVIRDVFSGASTDFAEDKDVQEEVKKSLIYLVENEIISAKRAEDIIRSFFPALAKPRKMGVIKNSQISGPTLYGPFDNIEGDPPCVIDMSRMGVEWITKFSNADPQSQEEMLRPHIEAHNARQEKAAADRLTDHAVQRKKKES
jgi:hypothetical protein